MENKIYRVLGYNGTYLLNITYVDLFDEAQETLTNNLNNYLQGVNNEDIEAETENFYFHSRVEEIDADILLNELKDNLLKDNDFKELLNSTNTAYETSIKELLKEIDILDYILNKEYVDIAYFKSSNDVIIDLDELFNYYKDEIVQL